MTQQLCSLSLSLSFSPSLHTHSLSLAYNRFQKRFLYVNCFPKKIGKLVYMQTVKMIMVSLYTSS